MPVAMYDAGLKTCCRKGGEELEALPVLWHVLEELDEICVAEL